MIKPVAYHLGKHTNNVANTKAIQYGAPVSIRRKLFPLFSHFKGSLLIPPPKKKKRKKGFE